MQDYKKDFINFMAECDVLKFGDFTLKSGRRSPFFMNAGVYTDGAQLIELGKFYAQAIYEHFGLDFDVVFGPAYKGIPLSVVTCIALEELYDKKAHYCSNRKELKDHGDAGMFLGKTLEDDMRVVMVEDVTTSGKSIDETWPLIKKAANVDIVGLIVSLNRLEVGREGKKCALDEVSERYSMPCFSIVDMNEVTQELYNKEINGRIIVDDTIKNALDDYYKKYGAVE